MRREALPTAEEIFDAALDLDFAERKDFVERACARNSRLCAEVKSLLQAFDSAGSFLETPLLSSPPANSNESDDAKLVGQLVGPYRLVSLIAAGGMGAVYKAHRADGAYDRHVAIKLVRRGIMDEGLRRRFHRERQTLAALEHPYIARLLDGGAFDDGQPYLVMELIAGLPITEYADQHRMPVRERLRMFSMVCTAVHYAHRNLIVHRDLKPANILVTEEGTPKLLDFGISQLVEGEKSGGCAEVTQTAWAMTPRYASPEHVRGSAVTTAGDVYSLGVILYELLAGTAPYHLGDKSRYEQDRIICEVQPAAPSAAVNAGPGHSSAPSEPRIVSDEIARRRGERPRGLSRCLRGDLDNIVLKAIQKDPDRRYASAQQFGEDVDRYLVGLPVIARKDSLGYRTRKYVARNKAASLASLACAMALLAAMIGTSTGFVRARRAQQTAQLERNSAVRAGAEAQAVTVFLQDLLAAANPYRRGREATVRDLLEDAENRIASDLNEQPGVEAGVRFAIARTYAGMWEWGKVIPQVRHSLSLNRRLHGPDDPRIADCLSLLGRALTFARDAEAVGVQQEGLAMRRRLFGEAHPAVAESTGNLGFALWHSLASPRWDEAETKYRESLAMYRELGVKDSADVARFTFSLAVMLAARSRFADAEPLFLDSLAMFEKLPVVQDRYRYECMRNYALMLRQTHRIEEAERITQQYVALAPDPEPAARLEAPDPGPSSTPP